MVLALLGLGACPEGPSAEERIQKPIAGVVLVVGRSEDDPIWRPMAAAAQSEGKIHGELEIRTLVPREPTAEAQIELLESQDVGLVRGLCIYPVDAQRLKPVLDFMGTRGVIVVTMLEPAPSSGDSYHVALDELEVGRLLAQGVVDAVAGRGTAAVLVAETPSDAMRARLAGMEQGLLRAPGVEVLNTLYCQGDVQSCRRGVESFSARYPRLGVWVWGDDWLLRTESLDEAILPAGCKLVSVNPWPDRWEAIEDGRIQVLVGPDVPALVHRALRTCAAVIAQDAPDERLQRAPVVAVTKKNLAAFRDDWRRWCGEEAEAGQ